MKKPILIFAGTTLLFGFYSPASQSSKNASADASFAVANVHFEQNATDGDVEVVFEAIGGNKGLAKLKVVAPDGRTVVDFTAPDASTLGIRSFRFESPEPTDVKGLKAAYPAGVYKFSGATATGAAFRGESTLNHDLPATVSFLQPKAEAEEVSTKDLKITWTPVKNLAAYMITIEQEGQDFNITTKLPGSATSFAVPNGFLLPGHEYKLGIGTVTKEGNLSMVETSFTTVGRE